MRLRDGELVASENGEYAASQLLPPGALTSHRRGKRLLVFPLAFEDQLLGVIAFNYFDGINAYAAFRNEIAAALKSVRLREELVQTSMLHERSLQERAAATKRMEALSVLAAASRTISTTPSDRWNRAAGRHPLPALGDRGERGDRSRPAQRCRGHQVGVAPCRPDEIKDLLTLGRQGRTAKENLDINRVIKSCWANNSLRFVEQNEAGTSRVKMSAESRADAAGCPRIGVPAGAGRRQPDS